MKRFLCWVVSSPLLLCIPNFIPHFNDLYIYLCFDSHILWFFWVREVDGIGEGSNFKDPSGFQKFLWNLWPGECPWNTLEKFGWFFTKLWNQDPHSLVAWFPTLHHKTRTDCYPMMQCVPFYDWVNCLHEMGCSQVLLQFLSSQLLSEMHDF
jgi:hypothetical protein